MKEEIEKYVVKYTRIIHPEDLGTPTSLLENTLREMLENYSQSFIEAEIAFIETINTDGGGSGRRIKEQLLGHLKELLVTLKK